MNYIGIDLHKKTITFASLNQQRQLVHRKTLACCDLEGIRRVLRGTAALPGGRRGHRQLRMVVQLLEPLAEDLVLAHPRKLRVIAESTSKSDKLDAQVLAEFLALDMVPGLPADAAAARAPAAGASPRVPAAADHVRARTRCRRILGDYNADRQDLFTADGLAELQQLRVGRDRFVLDQLLRVAAAPTPAAGRGQALKQFAEKAPPAEREARAVLEAFPGWGR